MEIKKIIKNGGNKIIVVPKKCDWKVGDYIMLNKVEDLLHPILEDKNATNPRPIPLEVSDNATN